MDRGQRGLPVVAASVMAIVAVALTSFRPNRANGSPVEKPTIVLVHGAWLDGSTWHEVADRLTAAGYEVRVPPNRLRGPRRDAEHLNAYLGAVAGPVVLVGHAYGGVVITNAAAGNDHVRALVYVDAFIPTEGDTVAGLAHPPSILAADGSGAFELVPDADAPGGVDDVYIQRSVFVEAFTDEGFSPRKATFLAASQRPLSAGAFEEPSGPPAWVSIPSWAVVGEVDRVIPLADQLAMARRAGALVVRIDASHLSMLTHARAVSDVILRAVRSDR